MTTCGFTNLDITTNVMLSVKIGNFESRYGYIS